MNVMDAATEIDEVAEGLFEDPAVLPAPLRSSTRVWRAPGRLPDLSEDARQSRRARLDALGLRAADVDEGALDRERAITRQMALRYVPTH